jgi:hypothetical protein
VTPELRKGAPFELLAFTAAPVAGALVVIELEGRVDRTGRFVRRPVLVVDRDDEHPRLELAPVTATLTDDRWHAVYAIPADALPVARFALGLRGTLLELPAPDQPDDAERLTALAREANGLRRALEAAEATIATTRAEAEDTSAELGAAVAAAHDEALAAAAADREQAIVAAQERVEEAERCTAAADERATTAEERARAAEESAQAAVAGTDVLRAELAEERERSGATIAALEAERDAAQRRADALRNAAEAETVAAPDPTVVHRPVTLAGHPPGVGDPIGTPVATHHPPERGVGPWIAVGALVLFAFVLLGLLFGFLA